MFEEIGSADVLSGKLDTADATIIKQETKHVVRLTGADRCRRPECWIRTLPTHPTKWKALIVKARQLLLAAIHPRLPIEGELPSLGSAITR
jgi:hypothetical protein